MFNLEKYLNLENCNLQKCWDNLMYLKSLEHCEVLPGPGLGVDPDENGLSIAGVEEQKNDRRDQEKYDNNDDGNDLWWRKIETEITDLRLSQRGDVVRAS